MNLIMDFLSVLFLLLDNENIEYVLLKVFVMFCKVGKIYFYTLNVICLLYDNVIFLQYLLSFMKLYFGSEVNLLSYLF